jgi:hypothetical protein
LRIQILSSTSKNKNLDFNCFATYNLLSFEADVNVTTVSTGTGNNQEKKNLIFVSILKITEKMSRIRIRNLVYGSKNPDPSQNVTVPAVPRSGSRYLGALPA